MKTKQQFALIFFSIIFLANLQAQDEKKFHKGFHLHLKNAFFQYNEDSLSVRQTALHYSFGYHITYDFSSRVGMRLGARFSGMKVSGLSNYLLLDCNVTSAVFDYTSSYVISHYKFTYIGIPLSAKVKLVGGKNHLYLTVGGEVLYAFIINGYETVVECGEFGYNNSNIHGSPWGGFLFKFNGGIGAEIEVSKKLKVFFEPQIEYSQGNVLPKSWPIFQSTFPVFNYVKVIEIGMMVGLKF